MHNLHITICNNGLIAFDGNCSTGYFAFELLERWYKKNNRELSISSKYGDIYLIDKKTIEDDLKNAERYEKVRKLNVVQFQELFQRNIKEGIPFDQLVDELQ